MGTSLSSILEALKKEAAKPAEVPEVPNEEEVKEEEKPKVLKWAAKVAKSWGLQDKIMFYRKVKRGYIVSRYDRKSRTNSVIEESKDGKSGWKNLWNSDEETIGPGPEVAGVIFLPAERGENVLKYNIQNGTVSRGAGIPEKYGYKWNVFGTVWKNRPVIGADGPDKKAIVFYADDGKIALTPVLDGLIAGMCEDKDGVLWIAISDSKWGICNSAGWRSSKFKPASVAYFNDTIYAGSMRDGRIYKKSGDEWIQVVDLKASKVNRLVPDPRRNVMLVAASNPDTFVALHPDGTVEQIFRSEDQKAEESGEQFDATIEPGEGSDVLIARSTAKGCEAIIGTPVST